MGNKKGKRKKEPGTSRTLTVGGPKSDRYVRAVAGTLDSFQYLNRHSRILAKMPSAYWADEQFAAVETRDARGHRVTRWVMRGELSIPAGFRVCPADFGCGRHMPGISIKSSGHCDECIIDKLELPRAVERERAEEALARRESRSEPPVEQHGNAALWGLLGEVLEQVPQTAAKAAMMRLECCLSGQEGL